MRHFETLLTSSESLFERQPIEFDRSSSPALLAVALGATLYLPATRRDLYGDLVKQFAAGVRSCVVCLEDAVPDDAVAAAESHLVAQLRSLWSTRPRPGVPLTFVRVRYAEQIGRLVGALGEAASLLSGFVLPKFTSTSGPPLLDAVEAAQVHAGARFLAMPVLESPEIVHLESRLEALLGVAKLLGSHRESVLAVRIGATDLASAFALRRPRDLTVYDVTLLADVIGDIVNVLGRAGKGFVVTGPVWEHFADQDRLFRTQLRQTPFVDHSATDIRAELVRRNLDGLVKEVTLDKAAGLMGKTVIHPSHVLPVHAMMAVTHEEFADALDIVTMSDATGGVRASTYNNKMNEAKPHRVWADRTMLRADAFGVLAPEVGFVDLFVAGLRLDG